MDRSERRSRSGSKWYQVDPLQIHFRSTSFAALPPFVRYRAQGWCLERFPTFTAPHAGCGIGMAQVVIDVASKKFLGPDVTVLFLGMNTISDTAKKLVALPKQSTSSPSRPSRSSSPRRAMRRARLRRTCAQLSLAPRRLRGMPRRPQPCHSRAHSQEMATTAMG